MWLPGPPERADQAREALGDVLDHWLSAGPAYLMIEGGWPLDPPASSSEAWSTILYALADASTAIGRYSHHARTIAPADEQELQALAQQASNKIARLAAAVLIELDQPIARDTILTEASKRSITKTTDSNTPAARSAACSRPSSYASRNRSSWPHAEHDQAAVKILSPLVAQAA